MSTLGRVSDGSRVHSLRQALDAHGLHGAIADHSHPLAATFSIDDIAVLFNFYPTLRSTVVVAAEAWWYVMSPMQGTDPYPVTKIHRAYLDAWRRLEPQFLAAVDEGEMTAEQAGLELHRAIWRTIAGALNFLYHEVEVSTT